MQAGKYTVSRVKKIISQDPEIQMCSNNAAFVVTLAAVRRTSAWRYQATLTSKQEMFIQYLAGESHTQVKLDRKPRKNVQYKDVGKSTAMLCPLIY